MLGNEMTVKTGVMKSGKALVDGNECVLKLTPELLIYESPDIEGSIFLKAFIVLGIHSEELVLDYQKALYELVRIRIKPTSDITLHRKKKEFDSSSQRYVVTGDDDPHYVGGGLHSWLAEWYATVGCGLGDVLGFDLWDEQAALANERGEKPVRSLWVSPISFLYEQVTITNESYLFDKIYSMWKEKVETASTRASSKNPIDPVDIVNFAGGPDFYRNQNLGAILEKRHGLGIDCWALMDIVNIGKYSQAVRSDWAKLSYIEFMLRWIAFRSGHGYSSEYGLWPEEYEKLFLKTGVIDTPFVSEEERRKAREVVKSVELTPTVKRMYDEETLKTFKEWFAM